MRYLLSRLAVFAMLPAVLLTGGCNKEKNQEPPTGEYYVKFKVNGQQKTLTVNASAGPKKQTATNGMYHLGITAGVNSNGINNESILVTVFDKNLIKAGAYQNGNNIAVLTVSVIYIDEKAKSWSSVWVALDNWKADGKVIIDELNDQYIKGRFSSSVYGGEDLDKLQTISDGSFFVPLY